MRQITVILMSIGCGLWSGCEDVTQGTQVVFKSEGPWSTRRTFFDFPFPSDFRQQDGQPVSYEGFPTSEEITRQLPTAASGTSGFSVLPVAYFRFSGPLANRQISERIEPEASAPLQLIELGEQPIRLPLVAETLTPDAYVATNVLAMAPSPGKVLKPKTRYAFLVMRNHVDANNEKLGIEPLMLKLLQGEKPPGDAGSRLHDVYRPLRDTLKTLKVNPTEVAAATVFTTGDVVEENARLLKAMREKFSIEIKDLALQRSEKYDASNVCHLAGRVSMPQFQKGTPPFNVEGLFELDSEGLPLQQRLETVPVSLTLPRRQMPESGFPLVFYFHGSGGVAKQFVSGGNEEFEKDPMAWWPASNLAEKGLATAGASLPLSPDRLEGASDYAYLNLSNPGALRDTFRQGLIESALLLDALETLTISPALLEACSGIALPATQSHYRFSFNRLTVQGQSMGGMYTNLLSAADPRIQGLVPTGAGGYWSHFILNSTLLPLPQELLSGLLGTHEQLSHLHPAMHLLQLAWDRVDPLSAVPRLSQQRLEGHPVRAMYVPVGDNDSFFPRITFDVMALGAGNPVMEPRIWSSQLGLQSGMELGTLSAYPVEGNMTSQQDGATYTGVTVQYAIANDDGHRIFRRAPGVRKQYTCFHASLHQTGQAVVVAPDGDCP